MTIGLPLNTEPTEIGVPALDQTAPLWTTSPTGSPSLPGSKRMKSHDELFQIASRLESAAVSPELEASEEALKALVNVANEVNRSFSGSWLGYHAFVYYKDLQTPPPGAHFSREWGSRDMSYTSMGSRGDWYEYDPHALAEQIRAMAGDPDLTAVEAAATEADETFGKERSEITSILSTENPNGSDTFLAQLATETENLRPISANQVAEIWCPKGQMMTRDMIAAGQGMRVPPHKLILAQVSSLRQSFSICKEAGKIARKAASHLERLHKKNALHTRLGTNVFLGHGRSTVWRELKDFIQDRLCLPWDEFNRVPVAGITNQTRLSEMLDAAAVALIIMTAEDESAEGVMQARMNVIHEVGLFQGRLGFTKAIVLLEEGCQEFSNIQGLGQIRFPTNNVAACFEEVRRVLEREGL